MLTKEIAKMMLDFITAGGKATGRVFCEMVEKEVGEKQLSKTLLQFDELLEINGYHTPYQTTTVKDMTKIRAMTSEEIETLISKIGA